MKPASKKEPLENLFLKLKWIDIQRWAGSKILSRGKSYQRSGYVEELSDIFFDLPLIITYKQLKKVSEKANLWNNLRPEVISFLSTGKRPKTAHWPLQSKGIHECA